MGWPWSRWRCMDNWVLLVHPWKTVGMVSSVLATRYPGLGLWAEYAQVTAHWVLG